MENPRKNKVSQPPGRLKLAYIIGTYPEITTTFIDREIQALRELGIRIQILSIRRPRESVSRLSDYEEINKHSIYLLPANWFRLAYAHLFFALRRPRIYFKTLFFLFTRPHPEIKLRLKTLLHFGEGIYAAYLLRFENWDHIHAHFIDRAATVALIVSRLLDIPYSVTAHADDIYSKPVLPFEKLSEAKINVTVSEYNKAYLLHSYPGLTAEKIVVLHPWIDLARFTPPAARPTSSQFHILSVGRLVENKGHRYLIEACDILHNEGLDFECSIIGWGPLQTELEDLIIQRDLQGTVHLLGQQPQSQVLHHLCRADVFVLACTVAQDGARDGMPVAIAEAMAMELPVISTNIVGISEMVQSGVGFLIPEKNSAALAEAIRKIYREDQSYRTQMGKSGRAVIAMQFDLHKGIRELASLFEH
jgi:glycosyltransferase involved in cell wall biosynthesis